MRVALDFADPDIPNEAAAFLLCLLSLENACGDKFSCVLYETCQIWASRTDVSTAAGAPCI